MKQSKLMKTRGLLLEMPTAHLLAGLELVVQEIWKSGACVPPKTFLKAVLIASDMEIDTEAAVAQERCRREAEMAQPVEVSTDSQLAALRKKRAAEIVEHGEALIAKALAELYQGLTPAFIPQSMLEAIRQKRAASRLGRQPDSYCAETPTENGSHPSAIDPTNPAKRPPDAAGQAPLPGAGL